MVALRQGRWPQKLLLLAARLSVAGPLALVAGCASDKPSHVSGPMAQTAAAQPAKIELEDDGAPVQPPPARATRPEEDDPSQPWSPNYGPNSGNGGAASVPQPAPNPRLPRQVDASAADGPQTVALHGSYIASAPASTGALTNLSARDADAVIAQAINAQETRRH